MAEFKLSIDLGDGKLAPVTVEAATLEEAAAKASASRDALRQAIAPRPASFDERFTGEPPLPAIDVAAPQARDQLGAGLVKRAEEMGRPTPATSALIGAGQSAALGSWLDEATGALGATFDKRPDESWSDAYTRHQQAAQSGLRTSEAINPKSHLAGQAAGIAATLPIGGGAGRAGAMATGAVTGALSGAGEGDTAEQRAANAGIGTVAGAVGGVVAPELGRAIGAGVDLVRRGAGRLGSALGLNATGKLQTALRAAGVDEATVRRMIDEAAANGQDLTLGDVGGPATGRLAREAANLSPGAQSELQGFTGPRAGIDERVGRIRNFIDNVGVRGETAGARDALTREARRVNDANYTAAYNSRGADAIWTEPLSDLSASPAVKEAMRLAQREGADIAATQGVRPPRNPFEELPDGALQPRTAEDGSTILPSLQFWDYTKRKLSDLARSAPPGSDRQRVIQGLERQLRAELDQISPAYRSTRSVAAQFFGHDEAIDAGRDLLNTGLNAEAAQRSRRAIQAMSPADRALLELGFLDEAHHRAGKAATGEPAQRLFGSPNQRNAAELVLGPQRAARLEQFLEAERLMTAFHGQVAGNSSTARQTADLLRQYGGTAGLGAAAGAGASLAQGEDEWAGTAAKAGGGLAAGAALAGSRGGQAGRLARLLTSTDPQVQDRVLRAMSLSPALRRQIEQLVAQGAGRAGGGADARRQ